MASDREAVVVSGILSQYCFDYTEVWPQIFLKIFSFEREFKDILPVSAC